jgi:hypothetical protein
MTAMPAARAIGTGEIPPEDRSHHPYCRPSIRANTIPPIPTDERITPPISRPRPAVSSRVSGTYLAIRISTTSPTGMLIQKAQRHDTSVVSQPPTRGPTAAMPPMVEPHTANAMARSFPRKTAFRVERVAGRIIAAPAPCSTLAPISIAAPSARPARTLAPTNTAMPTAKRRRRP